MPLTIRGVLELQVVSDVHPQVLSKSQSLDAAVPEIHVAESADMVGLLEGGELILSSGLSLTPSVQESRNFLQSLAEAGASGVIFSFLSDSVKIRHSLETAAATATLPVILLDDRARFVDITEAVHEIIYSSAKGLSGIHAIPNFLASASAERLGMQEFFFAVANMFGGPLVLEDALSTVVLYEGLDSRTMERFAGQLDGQEISSRGIRTVDDKDWLSYPIIAQGRQLGQLISPLGSGNLQASMVLEDVAKFMGTKLPQGAADLELLRRNALATIVRNIRSGESVTEQDALLRVAMLRGESVEWFLPVALHFTRKVAEPSERTNHDLHKLTRAFQKALLSVSCPAFACEIHNVEVGIVLCLGPDARTGKILPQIYQKLMRVLARHDDMGWTMGVGPASGELTRTATLGLDDAYRVAHSASSLETPRQSFYRASDLSFRWLLQRLLDEQDSRTFVHDQLGPLLDEPEYIKFIETYLESNGVIAELSRAVHLSRPRIYARIRRIEKVLGHDLNNADVRTSLHLAVTLYRLGIKG